MGSFRKRKTDRDLLKTRIVSVATDAFTRNGIRNVKMDDVAAALSISKRTLYEVFGDKEELLLEVVKGHHGEMKRYMESVVADADNVLEVIIGFYMKTSAEFQKTCRGFFEDIKRYPKVTRYLEDGRKDNINSAMAFYRRGVEQGIFRADVNYRIVQEMIRGQMDALMHSEACLTYSMLEIFETLVFMHMRGISTERGLKIVNDFLRQLKEEKEN